MISQKLLGVFDFHVCVGCCCVAVLSSCASRDHTQTVVLDISARSMWVDTGLDVSNRLSGSSMESGTWSNDGAESHFCDAKGSSRRIRTFEMCSQN